jgi:hypothetical protein
MVKWTFAGSRARRQVCHHMLRASNYLVDESFAARSSLSASAAPTLTSSSEATTHTAR